MSVDRNRKGKMRAAAFLMLCLLVSGTALAMAGRNPSQRNDSFSAFWKEFKNAVITRNKKAVAALSRFPVGVSVGVPSIESSTDLSRRFAEVFDQDTNAAQCFAKTEPTADTESQDRFSITCPNKEDNFVVYEFEQTKMGWRFIHRQFPTKCGCR